MIGTQTNQTKKCLWEWDHFFPTTAAETGH